MLFRKTRKSLKRLAVLKKPQKVALQYEVSPVEPIEPDTGQISTDPSSVSSARDGNSPDSTLRLAAAVSTFIRAEPVIVTVPSDLAHIAELAAVIEEADATMDEQPSVYFDPKIVYPVLVVGTLTIAGMISLGVYLSVLLETRLQSRVSRYYDDTLKTGVQSWLKQTTAAEYASTVVFCVVVYSTVLWWTLAVRATKRRQDGPVVAPVIGS
ncbi:hypothetical protein V1512DRAFT_247811 [Lipomyces arxii]|uniref:uncharacterized protein n=1 Tax=Lipomyces arxii TaxID=56418 RepID=UPI0034CD0E68